MILSGSSSKTNMLTSLWDDPGVFLYWSKVYRSPLAHAMAALSSALLSEFVEGLGYSANHIVRPFPCSVIFVFTKEYVELVSSITVLLSIGMRFTPELSKSKVVVESYIDMLSRYLSIRYSADPDVLPDAMAAFRSPAKAYMAGRP